MRFDLDDHQRAFGDSLRSLLAEACPPARALEAAALDGADLGIWRTLMAQGVGAIAVPEAHGGLGLGVLDLAVAAEAVGWCAAPGPFFEHAVATLAIVYGGDAAQQARWLPRLGSGEARATFAFAEANGAWSPRDWRMSADAALVGVKRYVLHGDGADLIVVGLSGGRLALVEGSARGVCVEPASAIDLGRRLCTLRFEDTPCEPLGEVAGQVFDAALVLLAADAFGGASRCLRMAVDYAMEREQFGRKIAEFQALRHQLADMALLVEPSVGLFWYAAHMLDGRAPESSEAAALAKAHITELYPRVARRMIEIYGGIGYTWAHPAHVWLKRGLFDQAYLGMPRQHRARVAELAGW